MHFRFEEFSADSEWFELRSGARRISVEPKVLRLLFFLLENHPRPLSKAELIAGVWSGARARVTDGSLSRALSLLREALGDRSRSDPILQTVRGKGYRINAAVERGGSASSRRVAARPYVGRADALERLLATWRGFLARSQERVALISLEPKILRLLFYLLEHGPRPLTKAELLAGVWSDAHVTEGSLSRALSLLREALGDRGIKDPILQTVRGKGYRINLPIEVAGADFPGPGREHPFVGREDTLERLLATWQEVAAGRGERVVLLTGPAGIGKTRLVAELASKLIDHPAWVVRASCSQEAGAPPLRLWGEGAAAPLAAPTQDASELGVIASQSGGVRVLRASPDSVADRLRIYDRLARFLRAAGSVRPLLLVLDDLHRADPATLRALVHAARELRGAPVLLLGIYRGKEVTAEHPIGELLAASSRRPGTLMLALGGLSTHEVGTLARHLVGEALPSDHVRALAERTGGNPLFVREFVSWARERGTLREEVTTWLRQLPPAVGELIRERVARLSRTCQEALSSACIIGDRFPLRLLQIVTGLEAGAVQRVLAEATEARILDEDPHGSHCYRFTHSLLRETLRASLSPPQTMDLGTRTLAALERFHAEPRGARSGAGTTWRRQGTRVSLRRG